MKIYKDDQIISDVRLELADNGLILRYCYRPRPSGNNPYDIPPQEDVQKVFKLDEAHDAVDEMISLMEEGDEEET